MSKRWVALALPVLLVFSACEQFMRFRDVRVVPQTTFCSAEPTRGFEMIQGLTTEQLNHLFQTIFQSPQHYTHRLPASPGGLHFAASRVPTQKETDRLFELTSELFFGWHIGVFERLYLADDLLHTAGKRDGNVWRQSSGKTHITVQIDEPGEYFIGLVGWGEAVQNQFPKITLSMGSSSPERVVEAPQALKKLELHTVTITTQGSYELAVEVNKSGGQGELALEEMRVWRKHYPYSRQGLAALIRGDPRQSNPATIVQDSLIFATYLATRRHPLPQNLQRLTALAAQAIQEGRTFEEAMGRAFLALFNSVRVRARILANRGTRPLTSLELAERLSLTLANKPLIPNLFMFAMTQDLQDEGLIEATATGLLASEKEGLAEFGDQYLGFHEVLSKPTARRFDMHEEARLSFLELANGGPLQDLLNAKHTYVNQELAAHYGISYSGSGFTRVAIKEQPGFLTKGAFTAAHGDISRSSNILRLFTRISVPPPPKNVPSLGRFPATWPFWRKLAQHRENPSCNSCHLYIDPAAVSYHVFDEEGRFRTKDQHNNVIPRGGQFPGYAPFRDHIELGRKVLAPPDSDPGALGFKARVVEHALMYALGRRLERGDRCTAERIARSLVGPNNNIKRMLIETVKSLPFREIRPE